MDDRSYLHDGERLLLKMSPGLPVLLRGIARGFAEALVAGILFTLFLLGGFWLAFETLLPWQIGIGVILVLFGALAWYRRSLWKQAALRVTNDRILLQEPGPFSLKSMKTVKWSQYQESATKKGGLLEMAFGVKHLIVRYGTADAQRQAMFPGLPFATDIKHFLDKVDSAVRDGKAAELKTFVAKPRGKRDASEAGQ
ncbi:MAG TPA: hypothetical protein PKV72_00835 [Candidatus Peribacteria bacterium]|nr:hypothetical protein [Candidatus Peribacteria bacterium]